MKRNKLSNNGGVVRCNRVTLKEIKKSTNTLHEEFKKITKKLNTKVLIIFYEIPLSSEEKGK